MADAAWENFADCCGAGEAADDDGTVTALLKRGRREGGRMRVGGGRRGWGGNTTINSGRSCERGLDATRGLVSLGLDNIDCKVGGVSRVAWGSNGHSAVVPLEPSFNPSVVIWITNLSFVVCVSDGGCVGDTLGSGGAGAIGISAGVPSVLVARERLG